MKTFKKISLPVLFLLIFSACKSNDDSSGNIQPLNDSTAYHNNSATDSIKAKEENKATGSYDYYPKKSEANKNQKEESVSENKSVQKNQERASSGIPEQDQKKGWIKPEQGAAIADSGATGSGNDKK